MLRFFFSELKRMSAFCLLVGGHPDRLALMARWILPILLSGTLLAQAPLRFMGRDVTVTRPKLDESGFSAEGPASVCVEGKPRQCYTAPKEFGRDPKAKVITIQTGQPAIFFTVNSGGVSGWSVHAALLRPGTRDELENFLRQESEVSNQSEQDFWNEPSISNALIFVTANFVWGPDESHYVPHRYIISAYVLKTQHELADSTDYFLEDRYLTIQKYDYDKQDILGAEKQEILARLRRVMQQPRR
jgi:hypothetical protein